MSHEVVISLLTFGGTLLLVVTGLLNFSVFVKQLRAEDRRLEGEGIVQFSPGCLVSPPAVRDL